VSPANEKLQASLIAKWKQYYLYIFSINNLRNQTRRM